jgi:hypothetical protein
VPSLVRRAAPWAALAGLAIEGAGATWDIAWHGDIGRDRFLTPPHVAIVCGIAIVLLSAAAGCARGIEDVAGLAVAGIAAALQLAGLAIDNWWHGIFGVDVTLWSPPHLLLLALGYLAFLGLLADRARRAGERPRSLALWSGGFLAATTLLLAEYDFGFPHFALLWSAPVLAICLGVGLGLARATSGWKWAGTAAAGLALAFRGATMSFNALVHRSVPIPPLGIAAGGLAFDLACVFTVGRRSKPRWGLAGVLAWVACFPAQAAWLHAAGKTWWPAATLLPGLVIGAVAAAGATIGGAFVGRRLSGGPAALTGAERGYPAERTGARTGRPAAIVGALALAGLVVVAAANYHPVDTGAPGLRFSGAVAARAGGLSLVGRHATLWVAGAGQGDWVSVFKLDTGSRAGWTWIGGLTWQGAGRLEGTLRRSPDSGANSGDVPPPIQLHQVGIWLVSRGSAWAGIAIALAGPGAPGVVLANSGVRWVGSQPPVGPPSTSGMAVSQVALFHSASVAPRPVSSWLTPVAYLLVLAVLAAGVLLAGRLLFQPTVKYERRE